MNETTQYLFPENNNKKKIKEFSETRTRYYSDNRNEIQQKYHEQMTEN